MTSKTLETIWRNENDTLRNIQILVKENCFNYPRTPPRNSPLTGPLQIIEFYAKWKWILLFAVLISGVDGIMQTSDLDFPGISDTLTGRQVNFDGKQLDLTVPKRNFTICGSRRIVNSVSQLRKLRGCSVIEGNLQIVLIESDEDISAEWERYSFPELVQITGFLLVFRVHGLRSLGQLFPNLAVIRGMTLQNDYALVIYYAMQLETVGLQSLTSIMRGSVRIQENYNLCNVDTIDWSAITEREITENVFKNNNEIICNRCNSAKKCSRDHCWSSSQCQQFCSPECGNRSCISYDQCCHELCVGGCTKPDDSGACIACRNVSLLNMCLGRCGTRYYKYLGYRCVGELECIQMGDHLLYDPPGREQECVRECPVGYQERIEVYPGGREVPTCKKCDGVCTKICRSQFINSIEKAQALQGCTVIDGPLIISITGGKNISKKVTESLKFVRVVRDYVRIFSSNALMSMEFLSSLEVIEGRKLYIDKYALYIHDNENLEMIWDWNTHVNLTITKREAKVLFHSNPRLCYQKIEQFLEKVARQSEESNMDMKLTNGNKIACRVMKQNIILKAMRHRGVIEIKWHTAFITADDRMLSGYYVYYKASKNNETYLGGRDACDDDWTMKYVEINKFDTWIVRYLKYLEPDTRYAIYVETDTVVDHDSGARARSNIDYTKTLPYNPDSPKNLKILKITEDSVTMGWSPPRQANGVIDHYVVRVKPFPFPSKKGCPEFTASVLASEDILQEKVLKDDVSSTTPPPVSPDGEAETQQNFLKECCLCPLETRRQQLKKDITFKDALFYSVYTGHTFRQVRDTHEESISMYTSYTDSSDIDVEVPQGQEPFPSGYIKPSPFMFPKKYLLENRFSFSEEWTTSTKNTTIFIPGLSYYTRYRVEVSACHPPFYNEERKQVVLCSLQPATKFVITMEKSGANQVTNFSVVGSSQSGNQVIGWYPPEYPNGELIAYVIVLQPQTTQTNWALNRVPQPFCITAQEFEEKNNTFELPESAMDPGVYTLSVKAYTNPPSSLNESYVNIPFKIKVGTLESVTPGITAWASIFGFSVLMVLVVIAILFKLLSKKSLPVQTWNEQYVSASETQSWSQKIQCLFSETHILQMHNLQLENDSELGKGHFGVVVHGNLSLNNASVPIAAKVVTDSQAKDEILDEAKLMLKLDCYHLVKAYGVAAGPTQVYLVMEYMARGDLLKYLRSLRPSDNDIFSVLSVDQVCAMAVQIADGMAYLACHKIVHRDLAARNCLIDDQLNIKISDFGMSRVTGNDYYMIHNTKCFPVRWLPPEYLNHSRFTSQSDVWSYGVVVFEILTGGARPYKLLTEEMVWEHVVQGHTLEYEIPADTPGFLSKVLISCWKFHDHHRPYFPQIIAALFPSTSHCFAQHFRMVSFYHADAGQEYKSQTETLLVLEAESDDTAPVTTPSSSQATCDDPQPPPLPSRPLLGLKWPTSLSFRAQSTTKLIEYSLESPASEHESNMTQHILHTENRGILGNGFVDEKKRQGKGGQSNSKSTLKLEKDSRNFVLSKKFVKHRSSTSDLGSYQEGQHILVKIGEKTDVPVNNVIVNINKSGAPSSSLASPKNLTLNDYRNEKKSFLNNRSVSSPNIKASAS
ncbi:insulin-like growth factor 1 receptor [Palaemon carinicauda]|uniref:insulin-like growth factor 1 receptor n=1 Tax=Palaemon carinicauda TaxID=392227 RepID=UPI0035B5F7DE